MYELPDSFQIIVEQVELHWAPHTCRHRHRPTRVAEPACIRPACSFRTPPQSISSTHSHVLCHCSTSHSIGYRVSSLVELITGNERDTHSGFIRRTSHSFTNECVLHSSIMYCRLGGCFSSINLELLRPCTLEVLRDENVEDFDRHGYFCRTYFSIDLAGE